MVHSDDDESITASHPPVATSEIQVVGHELANGGMAGGCVTGPKAGTIGRYRN